MRSLLGKLRFGYQHVCLFFFFGLFPLSLLSSLSPSWPGYAKGFAVAKGGDSKMVQEALNNWLAKSIGRLRS